jgi:hypothetical protein
MNPVPLGAPGEFYIGGEGVASGYLKPELSAERRTEPFCSEAGGRLIGYGPSLGRRGRIRADRQVKLRGFRIELGEIEPVLKQHPAVEKGWCAEDGGGDKRLIGYVVPQTVNDESNNGSGHATEQVSQWKRVFDEAYANGPWRRRKIQYHRWNSVIQVSCRPEKCSDRRTIARLGLTHPGNRMRHGALIVCLAPLCKAYVATDISKQSVKRATAFGRCGQPGEGNGFGTCDDFVGIGPNCFDCVVMNR